MADPLKATLSFDGNPDEIIPVSPDLVLAGIPDQGTDWKLFIDRMVGRSKPVEYRRKGEIFDLALNAWAKLFLPQYSWRGQTVYEASWMFLTDLEIRSKDVDDPENILGFWTVTAQGLNPKEITDEGDPCYQHYQSETGTYRYFGWGPFVHKAVPYPAPCQQQFVVFEAAQKRPQFNPFTNDAFQMRFADGGGTTYIKGGGISASVEDVQATEEGNWFVSLPGLPDGAPFPPPLIGRVIDYGPPGPPGPPGPEGAPGETVTGAQIVDSLCALPAASKDALKNCLAFPEPQTYLQLVEGATPLELNTAQQTILKEAPETVIPKVAVELTNEGEATFTAMALETGGWALLLTLPIALLIGMKMILEQLRVVACDAKGEKSYKSIPFPVLSLNDASQLQAFQELFNQISWLLRCCPPCELNSWVLYQQARGSVSFKVQDNFDAVMLKTINKPDPEIDTFYGGFTVFKLGNLRWLYYDHSADSEFSRVTRRGPLQFWNSQEQVFEANKGYAIGFTIETMYDGDYEIYIRRNLNYDYPLEL